MAFDYPGITFDQLETDAVLDSPLAHQAAWTRWHGYAIRHRTGGRIEGARSWGLTGLAARVGLGQEWLDIMGEPSTLWSLDGDDLVLLVFNSDQDGRNRSISEVRSEAGKASGRARRENGVNTLAARVRAPQRANSANQTKQTSSNKCLTSVERDEMRRVEDESNLIAGPSAPPAPPSAAGEPSASNGPDRLRPIMPAADQARLRQEYPKTIAEGRAWRECEGDQLWSRPVTLPDVTATWARLPPALAITPDELVVDLAEFGAATVKGRVDPPPYDEDGQRWAAMAAYVIERHSEVDDERACN